MAPAAYPRAGPVSSMDAGKAGTRDGDAGFHHRRGGHRMSIPTLTDLLDDALSAPGPAVAYRIGRALGTHFASSVVLQVEQEGQLVDDQCIRRAIRDR